MAEHILKLPATDMMQGTAPLAALNTKGVAKYSDFEPIEGYVSETVQDRK